MACAAEEVSAASHVHSRLISVEQAGDSCSRKRPFVRRYLSRFSVSNMSFRERGIWEQILGKRMIRTPVAAVGRSAFPPRVPNREQASV